MVVAVVKVGNVRMRVDKLPVRVDMAVPTREAIGMYVVVVLVVVVLVRVLDRRVPMLVLVCRVQRERHSRGRESHRN